jgi:hypothetical protein
MTDSNRHDESERDRPEGARSAYGSQVFLRGNADEPLPTPSWRARCSSALGGWLGRAHTVRAAGAQNMSWTCPACRAPHETIIDSDAESGRIVGVSCPSCGAEFQASVFFRAHRSGKTRVSVGVVWL